MLMISLIRARRRQRIRRGQPAAHPSSNPHTRCRFAGPLRNVPFAGRRSGPHRARPTAQHASRTLRSGMFWLSLRARCIFVHVIVRDPSPTCRSVWRGTPPRSKPRTVRNVFEITAGFRISLIIRFVPRDLIAVRTHANNARRFPVWGAGERNETRRVAYDTVLQPVGVRLMFVVTNEFRW